MFSINNMKEVKPIHGHVTARVVSTERFSSAKCQATVVPSRIPTPVQLKNPHQLASIAKEGFFARMAPRYVTERIHTPETLVKDRHIYREKGVSFFTEDLLEPFSGVLTVTVVSAKDLPDRDRVLSRGSDPYVEVSTGFSISCTESVYDDSSPVWDHNNVFDLLVMFDDVGKPQADDWNKIKVKVVDTDMDRDAKKTPGLYALAKYMMQGMDDLLGEGEIVLTPSEIKELQNSSKIKKTVKLVASDYSGGEVNLELTYKPFKDRSTNGKSGLPNRGDWLSFNMAKQAIASEATEDISFGAAWDSVIADFKKPGDEDLVFEKVAYIDHVESDTQCWISRNVARKEIVLAFRASIEDQDWLVNLTYKLVDVPHFSSDENPIKVHNGFLATWKCVERPVFAILDLLTAGDPGWRVHVSGFSLGAAMAAVASYHVAKHAEDGRYAVDMLSFAGPRVGNAAFAKEWGRTLSGVRVYNPIDLVPHVPFRLPSEDKKQQSLMATLKNLPNWFLNATTDRDYSHIDCTTLELSPDGKHKLMENFVDKGETFDSLVELKDAQNSVEIQRDEKTQKEVQVKVSRKTHAEPTHREMLRAMVKLPDAPRYLGQ